MASREELMKLYTDNEAEATRFSDAGYPGCYAMGYVPGDTPARIRKATAYELEEIEVVRKTLPPPKLTIVD